MIEYEEKYMDALNNWIGWVGVLHIQEGKGIVKGAVSKFRETFSYAVNMEAEILKRSG